MNEETFSTTDDMKAFQLLAEVADEKPITQRELANRLGVALGLVNSYIKNFVAKGYLRIKNYPPNRYAYLLTPHGLAEKTRLAYQHAHYFTNLYTVTRQDYLKIFSQLSSQGIHKVVFCGVDEVAEIAWLSLQEASLELVGVMDDDFAGTSFMGRDVVTLASGMLKGNHLVVITSLKRSVQLRQKLHELGINDNAILYPGHTA